jgi:hypothetical protein
MNKYIIMLMAAVLVFAFSSCKKVTGEGPLETENRAVDNFTGLSTSITGKINFTRAPFYKVQLQAQRNVLNVIETYRLGNELILQFKNNVHVASHSDIIVNISAPSLESLNLSGAANVNVTGNFVSTNFNTAVSGSGNLAIDSLKIAEQLTVTVSGSGNIRLSSGLAKTERVTVSGSGNVNLLGINAERATARISGSGNIKLHTTQTLDATISGSGDIYYLGSPAITTHISGSGKVLKL